MEIRASSGWIHLDHRLDLKGVRQCQIRLVGPSGTVFRFQPPRKFNIGNIRVQIKDSKRRNVSAMPWTVSYWYYRNPPFAFTVSHDVTLVISQHGVPKFSSPINISFVSLPHYPPLEIVNVSDTAGKIGLSKLLC